MAGAETEKVRGPFFAEGGVDLTHFPKAWHELFYDWPYPFHSFTTP